MRPIQALALGCALFLALGASTCATTSEPQVVTKEVRVEVAVPCQVKVSADPAYPDTKAALLAAPDIFERVRLLVAGRLQRIAREAELKAALKGCTG